MNTLFDLPDPRPVDKIDRPTRVKGEVTAVLVECPACKTLKTKGLPCQFCHEEEGK